MGWIIFGLVLGIIASIAYGIFVTIQNEDKGVDEPKQKIRVGTVLALILVPVAIFTAVASNTKVGTGEIAVMTRFGRVTGQELSEGFHWKSPLDKANIYDIKVQKEEADAAAASKDLQDVSGKLVLNYTLEAGKISEIHRTVGNLYKEKLIFPAIQEVFKSSTAKYDATTLITDRAAVKNDTQNGLVERLSKYGINVTDISIVNFGFSPEFTAAIEAKQVAQQQAQQAVFNAEKAKQDAQAEIERAKGQAEAQRLQQETLTPLLVQKLYLEKWDGKLPTYVSDGQTLFQIPTN